VSFYLKIKNIDGDVTSKGHEKSIRLKSMVFGVVRNLSVRPGHTSDREAGSPKIGDLVVTKIVDKSSPYLFEASCAYNSLGQVTIDACGSSKDTEKYLQYVLSDAMISAYEINGISDDEDEEKFIETIHLNFTKVEMKYIPHNSENKPLAPISAGYDIEKATKI
jgi:type VI secretion system secreted protein Hcp